MEAGLVISIVTVLFGVGASQANAQDRPFSLAFQGGVAFAGGEFGKYVGSGPSGTVRLAYEMRPGTGWFAEGGVDQFGGKEIVHFVARGPDIQKLHFAVGVEHDLVPPDLEGFEAVSLLVRVGGGVASLKSDDFRYFDGTEDLSFSTTSPIAVAGVSLGFAITESVSIFVDGAFNWAFVKEDATTDLAGLVPTYVHPFETAGTFPYGVGLSIGF